MRKITTVILLLLLLPVVLKAQDIFRQYEDTLKKMARDIVTPEMDSERLSLNQEFHRYFKEVLEMEGSINYPFDSLKTVSRLAAPDGSFRIISWYVPLSNHQFEYFGFFQSKVSKDEVVLYELTDKAAETEEPFFETLGHENWYGAYYTDLIHKTHRRKDYYLLLGWRGDNPLTRKRIIEPLKILGQGRPSFGEPVFNYENNRHRRIIFEYSSKVSMSMKYEPHIIEGFRRPQQIIIFDRISPNQSFLVGHYQFYFPETNVFDGFKFEEGRWIFVKDIDAKNVSRRPPPRPVAPRD